ncbi:hypothetical protein KUTeg_013227 [Tegillarca granosa]|uniref:DUF2428 domain-containing protein n=1 Tax=Tegillarca granosa TaxID=220873 RepID=A0ABQ9EYJ8_TEGGR|nr:hypothetical protein KUTeg_013227 [Tegillarca granosa]
MDRDISKVSVPDTSWLSEFYIPDLNILFDVSHFKQHDIHKLLKRLDVTSKCLISAHQKSQLSSIDQNLIEKFLSSVISCYTSCIESIKLARAVEKLLVPWRDKYQEFINAELETFILKVLQQTPCITENVVAVCFLIEQNESVRLIIRKHIQRCLEWIVQHLTLMTAKPPMLLTKKEIQDVYCFIKVVLQLFQYLPGDTCGRFWTNDSNSLNNLTSIVQSLFAALNSQDYGTDCVLLSGTTLALLLTSAPDPATTIGSFEFLLNCLLTSEKTVSFEKLLESEDFVLDTSTCTLTSLGQLSLLKGVVACSDTKVLSYKKSSECYIVRLFSVIYKFCKGPVIFQYQAFNLLCLYFKRLYKLATDKDLTLNIFADNVNIVELTLELVWLNWDSPVEDVPDFVIQTFTLLLELWAFENENINISKRKLLNLPEIALLKIMNMAWYTKGKYLIFSAILPYINSNQVLNDHPQIKQHLIKCLSTNYLAPSGGDLYKAFLMELKKKDTKESCVEIWKDGWMETVLNSLTSNNILLRNNTNHYWIPATLKVLPDVGLSLYAYLSEKLHDGEFFVSRQRMLHAWICVGRIIRNTTQIDIQDVDLLKEALYCNDEDVRSEAIGLLSSCLKKAEPLTETEISLFKECIPYNLKIDSAAFRIQFGSSIRRLVTRVRDSCLAMLKSKLIEKLDMAVVFIDWLQDLCFNNLVPGACYQRRKASLDIIQIIFDTLVYTEDTKQRKSFTPEATLKLVQYAKDKEYWNFFSSRNLICLLHCVLDGADDIQDLASKLVLKYFKFPLTAVDTHFSQPSEKQLACHILSYALTLCNSPKAHESQSGANLCKIIYIKYVVECQFVFSIKMLGNDFVVHILDDNNDPVMMFIKSLIDIIQNCLNASKSNVVSASRTMPIHGFLSAVTRCITETTGLHGVDITTIKSYIHKLLSLDINIVNIMLEVMGKNTETGSSPSFAEMGTALESWIVENQSDYIESTSLSAEHQYLLSWCWVNIKESCTSLGQLMERVVQDYGLLVEDDGKVLTENVNFTFLKVFMCCRHRGVIEGCRNAFVKYCLALFSSNDAKLNELPAQMLNEALEGLQSKASVTSTTRKSAGLPLIVQAVISCENKMKKDHLLKTTLYKLFHLASLPLTDSVDDQHDLPQVHGLNILKSLFSDSSLTNSLMPYISQAVKLVIDRFGSPAWSIRNAATRLFSCLVSRIFKQKKSTDESNWNSISLQEFSAHYPELCPFMLHHLDEALQEDMSRIDQLNPSLFPILTLLANLGPVESKIGVMDTFKKHIKILLGSPVYGLRQLAACSYVALIPSNTVLEAMISLLRDKQNATNQNYLHGVLCCIEKLLINIQISDTEAEVLLKDLIAHKEVYYDETSVCCITRTKYLHIVLKLCKMFSIKKEGIIQTISSEKDVNEFSVKVVGYPLLCRGLVDLNFELCKQNTKDLSKFIQTCLESTNVDKLSACLVALIELYKSGTELCQTFWEQIQDWMVKKLQNEVYPPNISNMLSIIIHIHMKYKINNSSITALYQWLKTSSETTHFNSFSAGILTIMAVCLKNRIYENRVDSEELLNWSEKLSEASQVTGSEDLRIAAGQSLVVGGEVILDHCCKRNPECMNCQRCFMNIIITCITLLQDDDTDVRGLLVDFVSSLKWNSKTTQYSSVQYNNCLLMVFEYVSDTMWWSDHCIEVLQHLLYKPGSIKSIVQSKQRTSNSQLFEQEDNNFFAESLYTEFYAYKALMNILKKRKQMGKKTSSCLPSEVEMIDLKEDMSYFINTIEGNFTVLSAVMGYLLLTKFIIELMNYEDLKGDNSLLLGLKNLYGKTFKITDFPPSFTNIFESVIKNS